MLLALILVPLLVVSFLIWLTLVIVQPPGRLAVEIGILLFAYSTWSLGSITVTTHVLKLRDANVELWAIRTVYTALVLSFILVLLGFLNLFGILPWR